MVNGNCLVLAISALVLVPSLSWAMRVNIECTSSFDYDYNTIQYDTGDCDVDGYMYSEPPATPMYQGYGDFDSGSGSGYYGWTCEWYTDSGELDGGDYTALKYELDYCEYQDTSSAAYFKAWLFIYRESGGGWTYVDDDSHIYYNTITSSVRVLASDHEYDDSEYKFVFLCRAHLDAPDANTGIVNCEIDDNQPGKGLYVED